MSSQVFSGTVSSVVYENDDFRILKVLLDDGEKYPISAKGNFPAQDIQVGTWVSFEGVWKDDPQYGRQLSVIRSPVAVLTWTDDKALAALSSYGVGPTVRSSLRIWAISRGVTLQQALDEGKLEGLAVDESSKEDLLDKWKSLRAYLDAAAFMAEAGIPQNVVAKVWATIGEDFQEVITEDPWILIRVSGISFKEADEVARKLGVPLNNPGRVRGAVLSASQENLLEGHVFTTTSQIVNKVSSLIPNPEPPPAAIAKAISELRDLGAVVVDREVCPGVVAVYDEWHHKLEKECAEILHRRSAANVDEESLKAALTKVGDAVRDRAASGEATLRDLASEALKVWAGGKKISLTQQQHDAAVQALISPVSLLTGLPGTGKTTTLMSVVSVLQDMGLNILLAAPTGIAAKRMTTVTGKDAYTIHRAFGAQGFGSDSGDESSSYVGIVKDPNKKASRSESGNSSDWSYGPGRPHPAQVIIVDESSMLDLHMLYRVLTSTSETSRVVFVGDPYQLPSVGSGDVLRDLVRSEAFPHSHLDQIFRQEGTSGIVLAAHDVHLGRAPKVDGKDFILMGADTEEEAAELITQISLKLKEKKAVFQVLSPRHAGEAGVTSLNQRLRIALNPAVSGLTEHRLGGSVVREGDRIMIVKNDNGMAVYNGDVGKISRIDKVAKEIEIKIFEGPDVPPRLIRYNFKQAAKALRLAYAQTVHKSQGQEYDIIVLPVLSSFGRQLQRNLFYTAITRAKKKVFLVGVTSAIEKAVENNRADSRNSFLGQRILRNRNSSKEKAEALTSEE
jgi:exodeoxyribonuclease V alpha subunit